MPIDEKPAVSDDNNLVSVGNGNETAAPDCKSKSCEEIATGIGSDAISAIENKADSSSRKEIQSLLTTSPPEYREEAIPDDLLKQMGSLLRENTLEAHEKAHKLLKDSALVAVQRWQSIHSNGASGHNFSTVSAKLVNAFAKKVLRIIKSDEPELMLELGTGFGNDAMFFARNSTTHVVGIESSLAAMQAALKYVGKRKWGDRLNIACSDFIKVLETAIGADLDMVYSHSTLHYSPSLVLREKIFPLIASVLRKKTVDTKPGKFCLAMKTAASASAKSPNQRKLLEDDPYNSSVDLHDKVFRIYPESKEALIALLEPSFDIEQAEEVPFHGYDRTGDTEIFCYIIATPKKKNS